MATLLEQGIVAARSGQKIEARSYFAQALRQDTHNEQAWLWLSDVVDTVGEQITCIEQVLRINPHHSLALRALQQLKSQPAQQNISSPQPKQLPPSTGHGLVPLAPTPPPQARKPYRLSAGTSAPVQQTGVHHRATASTPPQAPPPALPPAPAQSTRSVPLQPAFAGAGMVSQPPAMSTGGAVEFNDLPLVPVILFGTLSLTAIGGLAMIMLLLIVGV